MKRLAVGICFLMGLLFSVEPGNLWAGTLPLTFNGATYALGNYYVAPYQVSIGNTQYNLVCDDALDDVNQGEKWNATTETLSNLDGALFYDSANPTASKTAYEEAGWLVSQIFANQGTTAGGEYQYALWDLFDPGFSGTYGGLSWGDENKVEGFLGMAEQSSNYESNKALAFDANLVIYTPNPKMQGEAQEFFGVNTPQAPEPAAIWSLLVVLVAVALACRWADKTTVESSAAAGR